MSEPSKKPPKPSKAAQRRVAKVDPDLPDADAIRRLFPKRVVDHVNRDIGLETDDSDAPKSRQEKE
ncbi:MAG: hypothetical protein KDA20_05890 [Phycisphaerales bacterium]|nr:hypothetical protein [Phycisphaerales bacterium]